MHRALAVGFVWMTGALGGVWAGVPAAHAAGGSFGSGETARASVGVASDPVPGEVKAWSDAVWLAARTENMPEFQRLLEAIPDGVDEAKVTGLRESIDLFLANRTAQEQRRAELIDEAWSDLREALDVEDRNAEAYSNALREAVQLSTLLPKGEDLLKDPEIRVLVAEAERAAKNAEREGDVLSASELYARLSLLFDNGVSYQDDLDRLTSRQAMIRLYAPEKFWEMRNEHRVARGGDPLPAFNPRGESYQDKLKGISRVMILQAIYRARNQHVDPTKQDWAKLILAGLEGVRVFAETRDIASTFPSLGDEKLREQFLSKLDALALRLQDPGRSASYQELDFTLARVTAAASRDLGVPESAVLHEFGVGAMAELDDFSDIIWPHDLERFDRQTRGRFVGVGIQIRLDEVSNIHVVTPLAGTPAQRAGIRAGDVIRKVDGESTEGFSLDQAVDNITGPPGTEVVLTIEREEEREGETITLTKDLTIKRTEIDLPTVKGWSKLSPEEDDWSWLLDETNGIGYIRLSGFSDKTSQRLDRAIGQLKDEGARALILDLRFNPGGLLDQAVEVANRWVPEGDIVSTVDSRRVVTQRERAVERKATLSSLPTVVLINENSASASEIVSGAIQHYGDLGVIDALVLGQRSFGKGSVQNVYPLDQGSAYMKLTTQYYRLPSGRILHRKPGAELWGVEPDFHADLLPEQIGEMLTIRQNADVIPLDEFGKPIADLAPEDPVKLINDGIDMQLQTALVLLQTQAYNVETSNPVVKQALSQ